MTITRHSPVIPTEHAYAALATAIKRGRLDLRIPAPPVWLARWLEAGMWQESTTAERRELAAEAIERRYQASHTDDEPSAPALDRVHASGAVPAFLHDRYAIARPGTAWVPCAGGCERMLHRPRPAVAYCSRCTPTTRRQRRRVEPDERAPVAAAPTYPTQ